MGSTSGSGKFLSKSDFEILKMYLVKIRKSPLLRGDFFLNISVCSHSIQSQCSVSVCSRSFQSQFTVSVYSLSLQ